MPLYFVINDCKGTERNETEKHDYGDFFNLQILKTFRDFEISFSTNFKIF